MGSSRLIRRWRSTDGPSPVLFFLPLSPRVPLLLRVRGTGEGQGEGSPQGLRRRVGEVEQRTRGRHRVTGIAPRLDGGQEDGVHGLDLRQTRRQLFCVIWAAVRRETRLLFFSPTACCFIKGSEIDVRSSNKLLR